MLQLKRIYDEPSADDGFRVLVDRLWPRGLSKPAAAVDAWIKNVAPSPQLRKWFAHDPAKFDEFTKRYRAELAENPALDELRQIISEHPTVTLLYAARDTRTNQAVVLKGFLGL